MKYQFKRPDITVPYILDKIGRQDIPASNVTIRHGLKDEKTGERIEYEIDFGQDITSIEETTLNSLMESRDLKRFNKHEVKREGKEVL